MREILNYSACELVKLLSAGEISSREITLEYLKNITRHHNNSYITVLWEDALKKAESGGSIPYAAKDNISTLGVRTTCGSKMLENYIPVYNAEAINRLSDFVLLGKTNMDEFGMGASSETSYFGRVENPVCEGRVPGGSSSGSAVAVASQEAVFALGSDTGGSVRQPASFCGVVGYMPSYGLVSRYGLIAFASSLDRIGILSRNVCDCVLIAKKICGYDKKDSTCVKDAVSFGESYSVRGKKIAVPENLLSGYAADKVTDAAAFFEAEGAEIELVKMPYTDFYLEAYYIISSAEASSNLARFDGIRYGFSADSYLKARSEGFGAEVKRRIILGTFSLSEGYSGEYYTKAMKVRAAMTSELYDLFSRYDLMLSPVSADGPWRFGEKADVEMYKNDLYTVASSLAGIPAISVPAGFAGNGLPTGIQLTAGRMCDTQLLGAAAVLERGVGGGAIA